MKYSIELHKIKLTNLLIQFCLCFLVLSCSIKSHSNKHIMVFQAHSNNKQGAVLLQPLHPPKRKPEKCSPAASVSRLRAGRTCFELCCRCDEFSVFIVQRFFVRDAHLRNLTSGHRKCNTARQERSDSNTALKMSPEYKTTAVYSSARTVFCIF